MIEHRPPQLLALGLVTALALAPARVDAAAPAEVVARVLAGMNACFLLVELKTGKPIVQHGKELCTTRMPPCSTFKVPLALMGFDSGVINDLSTRFAWDGKPKSMKSWEHDQDPRSWLKNSAVWVSQQIARRLGRARLAKYMRDSGYGNADMSGGLETAWLSPEPRPDSEVRSSIAISAVEQVRFFSRLWRGSLPFSARARELTRAITYRETSPGGYTLHGKTGSGYAGKGTRRRLGWFVGRLAKGSDELIGVVTFTDTKEPAPGAGFAGLQAYELFKALAKALGRW